MDAELSVKAVDGRVLLAVFIKMGSEIIQLSCWNLIALKHVHYFHLENKHIYSFSV